jgi:hypothetical protein
MFNEYNESMEEKEYNLSRRPIESRCFIQN